MFKGALHVHAYIHITLQACAVMYLADTSTVLCFLSLTAENSLVHPHLPVGYTIECFRH